MGLLIGLIFFACLLFLIVRNLLRVTIHGKGLFFPNWERVDRKDREKTGLINSKYTESAVWKLSHYLNIAFVLGAIALAIYLVRIWDTL